MRTLILKDKKISLDQMNQVEKDFASFIKDYTDIDPVYKCEERDFSTYEKEASSDGDEHLTDKYLRDTITPVYEKYKESIDHVVIYIHRDNWTLAGIWGTNYSNIYKGYQVHVCRFDNRNLANAFGTRYHEWFHSPDAFIKTYTGVDINTLGIVPNFDKYVVHGGRPDAVGKYHYSYIRYQENTDALVQIAPYLREAYKKRSDLYNDSLRRTIISLLERYIVLLRQAIIRKNTVNNK